MMNPISEQRPIAQIIILAAVAALVKMAAVTFSPVVGTVLAAVALFFFPASVAILGLEGNMLKAVYPVALVRMVAGLGIMYAAVLGIIAGVILALALIGKLALWMPVQIAVGMFAVLSIFSSLGGALYERRHELGLDTWHSPERTAEKERQADLKQSEHLVTEAYGQVRVGSHAKAWDLLQSWLASRGHAVEDYRWVRDKVVSWPDPRYADRLTQEYVDRLLAAKRDGEALDAVRERLRADKAFRPKSAAATLRIAQLAASGGGAAGVARVLLSDFGERFAGARDLGSRKARHDGHARLALAAALLDDSLGRDADGSVPGYPVELVHGDSRVKQQFQQRVQYPLERADSCGFDRVRRARLTPTIAIH